MEYVSSSLTYIQFIICRVQVAEANSKQEVEVIRLEEIGYKDGNIKTEQGGKTVNTTSLAKRHTYIIVRAFAYYNSLFLSIVAQNFIRI